MFFPHSTPPSFGALIITIVVLVALIFILAKCSSDEYREHWANKVVLVNAIQQEGIVIGGGLSRDQGRMLNVRLNNGNVIYISSSQVTVVPQQKTPKEIEIERVESELKAKQAELNKLKEIK
jgi:hypothetical protein